MSLYRQNGYFLIHCSDVVFLNNHTIPPSVSFVAECVNDIWYTLEGNQIFSSVGIIIKVEEQGDE